MGYTSLLVRGLIRLFVPHGYTTLLFQGGVYRSSSCFSEMTGYTTLLFQGGVYLHPRCRYCTDRYTTLLFQGGVYLMHPITPKWYTTLLFPGGVYPAQVFSSPKCWSSPLTQQTSQQSIPASTTTMHLHRR